MSRDGLTDDRIDDRDADTHRDDRPVPEPGDRRPGVPMDRLSLPRGPSREVVLARDRSYRLRESESQTLATVGTFRVVHADGLQPLRTSRDAWTGDLRALADQDLIEIKTVEINRASTAVVVLTRDGKDLLEAHRVLGDDRPQAFHAGLVKPREIAHDAQLFRLYQAEAARIEADGGRVTRVVLDYELKHDYQTFLNRPDRPSSWNPKDDAATFAAMAQLPIVDGHLELPDLRIEYETADGRVDVRDSELVTEHYSRGQLAGKRAAGFSLYRAAGVGRGRGARGGTPLDPHHLESFR